MLIQADARHIPLADESVQTVVTSPPYWGLRDYGIAPTIWGGRYMYLCDDPINEPVCECGHFLDEQQVSERLHGTPDNPLYCCLHDGCACNSWADSSGHKWGGEVIQTGEIWKKE